jgi:hypothetical protein
MVVVATQIRTKLAEQMTGLGNGSVSVPKT